MKRSTLLRLGVIAVVASMGAACSPTSGASSPDDEITLGVVLSQTGPFSSIGVPELSGAKAAVSQINSAGGIDGRKIVLKVEDAQSTPQAAATAATKLIQNNKVVGIVGPEATALALAVAPIAQSMKVPMVSTSGSYLPALPEKYLEYSFTAAAATPKLFPPVARHWEAQGFTKIGVIGPKGDVLDQAVLTLESIDGVTITRVEEFQPGQADISSNMTNLAKTNPDAILVAAAAADAASAQRAWKTLGLDSEIVHLASQTNEAFIDLAGPEFITDKTIFTGYPTTVYDTLPDDNAQKEEATAFVEFMRKDDPNYDPGSLAVLSFNAVIAFRDALTAAGSSEPSDIRDALESTKMSNPFGITQRSKTDHDGSVNPYILATHGPDGWKYVSN